ncbi:MAG TPA: gluconokinase [Burkholderiales bacterium]
MIVVVMGVSGAGKTTIGRRLAERLGLPFIEGDDYHPPANVAKMASGVPLADEDRWPWLDALNAALRRQRNAVLACSALKAAYRARLLAGIEDARVVHLYGDKAIIAGRLKQRAHRYMPASLLDSQFAILEPPAGAIAIDVSGDVERTVEEIARRVSVL